MGLRCTSCTNTREASAKRRAAFAAVFLSLRRYDPDQVRRVAAPHLLGPAASQPPVGAPLGLGNYPQTASCTSRPKGPHRPKGPKLGAEVGSGHKDREFLPSLIDASTSLRKLACGTPPCSSSPRKRLSANPADRQFVVPAQARTQGQATEIPGFPLSRERRAKGAKLGYAELDYSLASGDPEPAPGMNRGRALLRQLVVKIMPLRIVALNQLKFPRAAPFLDPLFAEDRIGDGLVKLDKH